MRILQISNKAPYPTNDGSSIAIYNIAKGCIDNGAELHLLTINTKKHFKDRKDIPADFIEKSHYTDVFRNTDVTAIGALLNIFSSQSFFVSRFIFKEFEEAIIKKLKEHAFDIVHLEGLFVAPYMDLIRKHSKAKIVVRAHNVEHLIWDRLIASAKSPLKKTYLSLQNKRLKKLELQLLKQADAIVPITAYDAELLQKMGIRSKYFVSPTGIVLDKYRIEQARTKKNTIFHLASMDWMPNVEAVSWFLEQVWKPSLQNNTSLQCTLAGRFMPEYLMQLNKGNLQVRSSIDNNIDFYNEYDIMLVPLQSGSGMRIKIIEGLAMGKAIVSTSVGAEGIPVTHMENIVIADTPVAFSDAIQMLCDDPELKKKISTNARAFIETHFDNTKLVGELIGFYRSL
jgi:glycosyltransferase involved in cell wall biosynthesis